MNGNLVRVTNDQDPVTQVPSKVFGYRHPTGEVHIRPGNVTLACAGQEDQVRARVPIASRSSRRNLRGCACRTARRGTCCSRPTSAITLVRPVVIWAVWAALTAALYACRPILQGGDSDGRGELPWFRGRAEGSLHWLFMNGATVRSVGRTGRLSLGPTRSRLGRSLRTQRAALQAVDCVEGDGMSGNDERRTSIPIHDHVRNTKPLHFPRHTNATMASAQLKHVLGVDYGHHSLPRVSAPCTYNYLAPGRIGEEMGIMHPDGRYSANADCSCHPLHVPPCQL